MDRWRSSGKSSSKNSNNNSNTSFSHDHVKDAEPDELGEIHPQITPEGYGLRTPYGTHFNLDFLQYCQGFAGQDTSGSRSSSGRSSLVSSGSKPESTNDVTDSKASSESTLWETRRRLDMFRSYRKRKPDHKQQLRYNEHHLRSSGNSSVDDLQISESEDPTSPPAKVSTVQQQNLQTVREHMATALSRLKYLENEAKQIPILKVQISVLQQEKSKMTEQIKCYEEAAKVEAVRVTKVKSLPPPPPPRRKYKSIAVGTEKVEQKLGFSIVHVEEFKPKKKEETVDNSPKLFNKQFKKFQICSNASTQTDFNTENASVDKISQTDPVSKDDKSTGFCPESADFTTNTHILGIDSVTQTIVDCNDRATSTDGLINPGVERSTNTETLTVDKSVSFKPTTSDFTCYAKINSGVSVETSTDISIECSGSLDVVQCDAAVQFKPTVADFSVNKSPVMDDASVLADIRPDCKDAASQIQCETTDVGMVTKYEVADFSGNTELVEQKEIGISVTPSTSHFEVQYNAIKDTYDAYTNTVAVEKRHFEMQFQPSAIDSASDPITLIDITKIDFSVQCQPATTETAVDCIPTETKDMIVQVEPQTVQVGVDCTVNMSDAMQQIESDNVQLQKYSPKPDKEYEQDVKNTPSSLHRDVATDTSDLNYSYVDGNDIGTYVGQVESLLDEQQSLLAHQYKELGVVLDNRESPSEEHEYKVVVSNIPKVENVIIKKQRYETPQSVKDVCNMIHISLRSGDNFDENSWGDAVQVLKDEWFFISSTETADSRDIKDFCKELRSISPRLLSSVVNSLDETGNCPLHYAVSHKNFAVIASLVDIQEFNVNQYNNAGYTASMLAAITQIETENEVKAVTRLFQRADVCLHAKQAGQTALMLAVSHGCVLSAKLLLDAGADVNSRDEDGSTALMCATEHGHVELVKLLLAHPECDPTVADNDGSTAINIAMDAGQRDIGMLLYVHLNLDKSQDS